MSFVQSLVEFERRCEFSKLQDGHTIDACKINKSPTVSNGFGASSFEIWTANMAQSLTVGTLANSLSFIFGDSNWKFCSQLPCRHPKSWHSDADIADLGENKLCFYFLMKKIKTCWMYKNTVFANWENTKWAKTLIWCLLLIFKVVSWDPLK